MSAASIPSNPLLLNGWKNNACHILFIVYPYQGIWEGYFQLEMGNLSVSSFKITGFLFPWRCLRIFWEIRPSNWSARQFYLPTREFRYWQHNSSGVYIFIEREEPSPCSWRAIVSGFWSEVVFSDWYFQGKISLKHILPWRLQFTYASQYRRSWNKRKVIIVLKLVMPFLYMQTSRFVLSLSCWCGLAAYPPEGSTANPELDLLI